MIFEAVAGGGSKEDIAIDDLYVLNGACPPEGQSLHILDVCACVDGRCVDTFVFEYSYACVYALVYSYCVPHIDHGPRPDSSQGFVTLRWTTAAG